MVIEKIQKKCSSAVQKESYFSTRKFTFGKVILCAFDINSYSYIIHTLSIRTNSLPMLGRASKNLLFKGTCPLSGSTLLLKKKNLQTIFYSMHWIAFSTKTIFLSPLSEYRFWRIIYNKKIFILLRVWGLWDIHVPSRVHLIAFRKGSRKKKVLFLMAGPLFFYELFFYIVLIWK